MKAFWKRYIGALFFSSRWYACLIVSAILFLLQFFLPWLGAVPLVFIITVVLLFAADYISVFLRPEDVLASRSHAERFSNGDENPVSLSLKNGYPFAVKVEVVDEVPHQFQKRDVSFRVHLPANTASEIHYTLRPVKRGEYEFGLINLYASASIGFVRRRFQHGQAKKVAVYPSYIQMRKYQLLAIHDRLSDMGVKKIRRIGHSMEFEQIKEYVAGDDYRTLNWKATARKGPLMVNHFTDERSQQVYCMIDKGRGMKMPFEGLSLLDYAINASLVLLNVALLKQDRAGLITFSEKQGSLLMADKRPGHMQSILEVLYNQKTRYLEPDYERLYALVRTRITQRSLLVLFTNFESMSGLERQLPYLRKIARHHLLLVVFFENTELKQLTSKPVTDVEAIYLKTIAEKFTIEKKRIARELQRYGIYSILTAPENLTVNTINKYLELKARQVI